MAAWGLHLATAILWQFKVSALYEYYATRSGKHPPRPGQDKSDHDLLRSIVAVRQLFYTCLWTVKLSFLVFFRRLGYKVRTHKIWWWFVLIVTIGTYIGYLAYSNYKCTLSSYEYIMGKPAIVSNVQGPWLRLCSLLPVYIIELF